MGVNASKPRTAIVVTLDALGTIYKFREPIATQYIKVARECGLRAPIDEKDLMSAFKTSFMEISSEYPNHGKGQLDNPRAWWKSLTNDAFRKVVNEDEIPEELAGALYTRFSSSAGYELYPDALPFFSSMRQLKEQYWRPLDPLIFIGIISNGDPRVKPVLQSLGLRVGFESIPAVERFRDGANPIILDSQDIAQSPWFSAYNSLNDIDMCVTSYDVGCEKPDPLPFMQAKALARMNYASKLEQVLQDWTTTRVDIVNHKVWVAEENAKLDFVKCIHIGDDYKKDVVGALRSGYEALHLAREGEQEAGPDGTNVVTDLEEAAMAIRIFAAENLGSRE